MYKLEHESKGTVSHGINMCAGCGLEIVVRNILSVVGDDIILIIPPGCAALFSGCGIETSVKVAGYQRSLKNATSTAVGAKASSLAQGNDHTTIIGSAGDGATVNIGIQALSGAVEYRDKILYICYDDEACMGTGIQGNSSTPMFTSTTTTPAGKRTVRKDLVGIAMAHDIPYTTTASISSLADLRRRVQKAKDTQGPSLIHVRAPCPTGWCYASSRTVEVARRAVQTGCWALYGYEDDRTAVNYRPEELKPIEEYISLQGCFKSMIKDKKALVSADTKNHFRRLIKRLDDMSA